MEFLILVVSLSIVGGVADLIRHYDEHFRKDRMRRSDIEA